MAFNKKKTRTFNILDADPDFENCNGWSLAVNKKNTKLLKGSNIGLFMVNLTTGSMMGPHWNPMATEVAVVLRGKGMVRVVCAANGVHKSQCKSMRFKVKEGDVFVVPRFHPMAQISFNNESLVFMGFSTTTRRNHPQFLAGKRSVLQTLGSQVLAASFNVSNTTIDKVLASQVDSVILECISCAEEEERIMEEEKARMREEEEEARRRKEEKKKREEEEAERREEEKRKREEEEAKRREEEEEEARKREEEKRKKEEEEERKREEEEAESEEEEGRRQEEERRRKKEKEAKKREEEKRKKEEEKARRREEEARKQEEERRRKKEEEERREERPERREKERRQEEAEWEQEEARRQQEETRRRREDEEARERKEQEPKGRDVERKNKGSMEGRRVLKARDL